MDEWLKRDIFRDRPSINLAKSGLTGPPESTWQVVLGLLMGATFIVAAFAALSGAERLIYFLLNRLVLFSPQLVRPSLVLAILLGGLAMYQFKRFDLYYYGLFAIAFGLFYGTKAVYGWHEVGHVSDRLADWVAVMAAAYAIARGAEDYTKGRGKKRRAKRRAAA
jgi:hypothetical protein